MTTENRPSLWARFQARWAFRRGTMLRFWGHRTHNRELYQAATSAFARTIDLKPDFIEAYLARGLLYWRELHDAPAAIADFSSILRLDPGCSEALFYRGMAHQALSDYVAAAADLRAALAQAPHAIWYRNAHHQLITIESILEELAPPLPPGHNGLLPAPTDAPPQPP
jgi:tetratricopeptide (TPR) repeat protein